MTEAYGIVDRLGHLDSICVIGVFYGRVLVAAGEKAKGLAVLRRSEAGFRKLGQDDSADWVATLIAKIEGM